jgi:hypothetical protein
MADELITLSGHVVLVCDPDGPRLATETDALDLIGSTWGGAEVEWLALPVARLSESFLSLRTGLAGAVIQKFVNYRLKLALVGDIGAAVEGSQALADFVRESNDGAHVWFVPDLAALEARLGR